MSSEGKKKRGEAGQSNAKNIAFRYGGSGCDLSQRIGSTSHPRLGGSKFLNAMKIGAMLNGMDSFSDRMLKAADENMERCPSVTEEKKHVRSSSHHRSGRNDGRIVLRFGASCHDIRKSNAEPVDLSATRQFHGRHGVIRPNKDADRASSIVIAAVQSHGLFEKGV